MTLIAGSEASDSMRKDSNDDCDVNELDVLSKIWSTEEDKRHHARSEPQDSKHKSALGLSTKQNLIPTNIMDKFEDLAKPKQSVYD